MKTTLLYSDTATHDFIYTIDFDSRLVIGDIFNFNPFSMGDDEDFHKLKFIVKDIYFVLINQQVAVLKVI